MTSLRDILLAQKPARKTIDVEGWPVPVTVEEMSTGRRIAFYETIDDNAKAVRRHKDDPSKHPYVEPLDEALVGFIFTVIDDNGDLVFTLDDIAAIKGMSSAAIQKIYLESLKLANRHNIIPAIELEKKD